MMHLRQKLFDGWGCNVQGFQVMQASLWLAEMLFAELHPSTKHCLCEGVAVRVHWCQLRPGTNFPSWFTMPINLCNSLTVVGVGKWPIARVFSGSAWTPWASTMCPKNLSLPCENSHFWMFNVSPALCRQSKTARTRASCCTWFPPWKRISSIRHMTPSRSPKMSDMVHWNISGAELIPKGKRLKQKQPKGVIKVVNNFESSSKGICQKPLLASNFVNILLSPSMARLSSTEPMGWVSRCTALFSGVRSTQILHPIRFWDRDNAGAPLCEEANRRNDPCRSIESISIFTLGNNGWGIFLGV